jgi:hypothetical protein
LRNEPIDASVCDGWRNPAEPSDPAPIADGGIDLSPIKPNCPSDAPEQQQHFANEDPAGSVVSRSIEIGGTDEHATESLDLEPRDVTNLVSTGELNHDCVEPKVSSASELRLTVEQIAKLLVPMDKAALARLTEAEIQARRRAMYVAKRKWEMRH